MDGMKVVAFKGQAQEYFVPFPFQNFYQINPNFCP